MDSGKARLQLNWALQNSWWTHCLGVNRGQTRNSEFVSHVSITALLFVIWDRIAAGGKCQSVDRRHLILRRKVEDALAGPHKVRSCLTPVSYTHLRAHETRHDIVCRL